MIFYRKKNLSIAKKTLSKTKGNWKILKVKKDLNLPSGHNSDIIRIQIINFSSR